MKVRFYRGPMDGKTRLARDDVFVITTTHLNTKGLWAEDDSDPNLLTRSSLHIYRRTPYVHPDGSVFFEWEKPKGTRIS